jgi:nucleotidyltransferase/DNA polymerase involved in DNA repair
VRTLKGADFKITSRQTHLAEPTDEPATIFAAAEQCLQRAHVEGAAVRLIGIRIGDLTEDSTRQMSFL